MSAKDFSEVIQLIRKDDGRFEKGAYYFVRQALDHTVKNLKKQESERKNNHVSGQELLQGIRDYALEQFGPLAMTVFIHWGIRRCEDFGDIVFSLVEYGVLGKTEDDKLEDFSGGYDFGDAFVKPFLPAAVARNNRLADCVLREDE